MDEKFREYHQFTEDEFKELWKKAHFVFDTNTLLNMYRYSRKTVEAYMKVLKKLKATGQLWIPHQVGYEFYENRIDVIREFEKSYDEILALLNKAKTEVETKYKNHPFLDLVEINKEMTKGLSRAETKIKQAQSTHPQWLDEDEVLSGLDDVFKGCVGEEYDAKRVEEIKTEGQKRYDNKIPPGFKDAKKPNDRKFGDLILWYQIIDHANEVKKPIIFITGDVKEDWWLLKEGERVMPLPQLKKELLEKAGAEFHIYTADRFLEQYQSGEESDKNHSDAIKEVREIRELEEKRNLSGRIESLGPEAVNGPGLVGKFYFVHIYAFELVQRIMDIIRTQGLELPETRQLEFLYRNLRELRNAAAHGYYDEGAPLRVQKYVDEIRYILQKMLDAEPTNFSRTTYSDLVDLVKKLEVFLRDPKNRV